MPPGDFAICRMTADRADAVQIVERRLLGFVLLHQQQHEPIAGERAVDGFDRQRPADAERRDRQRQHDRAAQRNDGKLGRKGWVSAAAQPCCPFCIDSESSRSSSIIRRS